MKNLLMTLGVTAVATMALNVFADDALLSPRAAGNQVKHVAGVNNDVNLLTDHYTMTVSPRTAGDLASVAGISSEVNPVLACRNMIASPRAIQICTMTPGMPGCKTEAAAANP